MSSPIIDKINFPDDILTYKDICEKMITILNEEEKCIKTMDVHSIKNLVQKKQDCFDEYKTILEQILKKELFITFSTPVKTFVKNSNDQVLKKIEENVLLLKIESSILKDFFKEMTKQCETPQATYGKHKKMPYMYASLPSKEL